MVRNSNLSGRGSLNCALRDELGDVEESQTSLEFTHVTESRVIVIFQSHTSSVMEKNEFSFSSLSKTKLE